MATNEQVLPMVGELRNVHLATEVRYLLLRNRTPTIRNKSL